MFDYTRTVTTGDIMSENKWHLKHPRDERRTICGRTTKEFGFSPRTARNVTDDVKRFKTRPCKSCSKALAEMKRRKKIE